MAFDNKAGFKKPRITCLRFLTPKICSDRRFANADSKFSSLGISGICNPFDILRTRASYDLPQSLSKTAFNLLRQLQTPLPTTLLVRLWDATILPLSVVKATILTPKKRFKCVYTCRHKHNSKLLPERRLGPKLGAAYPTRRTGAGQARPKRCKNPPVVIAVSTAAAGLLQVLRPGPGIVPRLRTKPG